MNEIAEHTHFVGIDVSMEWLDVHVLPGNLRCRVANGSRGIWSLIGKLSDYDEPLVVMEASGGFEARALETISSAGIAVDQSASGAFLRSGAWHPGQDRSDRCLRHRALC